jgi:hypothetical protein
MKEIVCCMEDRYGTNKSNFQKSWIGTEEQYFKLEKLIEANNRITIHFTHFLKYYLINSNSPSNFYLKDEDFLFIYKLFNKPVKATARSKETTKQKLEHFSTWIEKYKSVTGYLGENLINFDQVALYQIKILMTNFQVNVREHFIQKLKTFITNEIFHKLKKNVPESLTYDEWKKILKTRVTKNTKLFIT